MDLFLLYYWYSIFSISLPEMYIVLIYLTTISSVILSIFPLFHSSLSIAFIHLLFSSVDFSNLSFKHINAFLEALPNL